MARNFTNENFETFLRENADGLRMRPSDGVWKNISKKINQRRRRLGLGLGIALLITTGAGYFLLEENTATLTPAKQPATAAQQAPVAFNENRSGTPSQPSRNPVALLNHSEPASRLQLPAQQQITIDIPGSTASIGDNTTEAFTPTIVDDTYGDGQPEKKSVASSERPQPTDPLTIESVLNSYKSSGKKKLALQIYFTPTVSYRKLSENKAFIRNVSPGNIPSNQQGLYDINNVVTHKPDFGFEIGVTAKYPILKNITVRGGLQFNINRYDVKVFHTSTQLATITLNDRNRTNSVSTATNYNTSGGGYKTNWLQNLYFQVSAPVGVEAVLKGDEKVKFGIASTIQPTYVLGDRAYLISTDYKKYAEVPWLIRRWNVNTSLETFVSYSTGHLKWQVGPQVRYQLLSSFVKEYPVKENLFDFGLKVGIGLNQR